MACVHCIADVLSTWAEGTQLLATMQEVIPHAHVV
jgi:hypothetical protein